MLLRWVADCVLSWHSHSACLGALTTFAVLLNSCYIQERVSIPDTTDAVPIELSLDHWRHAWQVEAILIVLVVSWALTLPVSPVGEPAQAHLFGSVPRLEQNFFSAKWAPRVARLCQIHKWYFLPVLRDLVQVPQLVTGKFSESNAQHNQDQSKGSKEAPW